jgi:hypothetical protein
VRRGAPLVELLEGRDLLTTFTPGYLLARRSGAAQPMSTAGPTGYTPAQVRHAYGFDQIAFNGITGDGSGQTIAVVDAYDDPTIANDLHQFDRAFGLPDPTFTEVNQSGGSTPPAASATWGIETSLDVEWAHASAPGARILLVEANSNGNADLFTAVAYAAGQRGVSVVSMSWGSPEFSNEASFDSTFTTPVGHAGVTFLSAPGDAGAPASYPSASPDVIAVGGTSLVLSASGAWSAETGWSGSAGGVSAYEPQPSYQAGVVTQEATRRATPDVAYAADPTTAFPIYDSYNNPASAPWSQIGGTSAGTPQWGALVAIADQGRALAGLAPLDGPTQTLPALYQLPAADFHDITSGTSTGTPGYSAGPGFDLVTGRGSPVANLVVGALVGYDAPTATAPWVNLGGAGTAVASGRNADGSQQLFTIGTDHALWVQTRTVGGSWGGWVGLGGLCTSLSVTTNSHGLQDVFVIGTDGGVWTRSETALGQWTPWTGLGGSWTSLTTGTNANSSEQMFAVAATGALWVRAESAAGLWGTWVNLGGTGRSPVVTRNSHGLLDVFIIGTDSGLWTRSQVAAGQWTSWTGLGGVCQSVTAGTNVDGTEQVFAVGTDSTVWTRTETLAGQWTSWTGLGGLGVTPVVARNSQGLLDLFLIGSDGAVWTRSETAAGQWSNWLSLGGPASMFTVVSDAAGRLAVFTDAANDSLAIRTQAAAGSWSY